MQIELSPDDIETIIREADAAARRLRRRLQLPTCDREDLGQDLLVDLLRRLPAFDPLRGSIGAFAGLILRNQSSRIAIRHHQQRRAQGGTILSLEVPLAGETAPVGATLAEADGLAAWHGQDRTALDQCDDRHALETALSQLAAEDRRLCAAMVHRPVAALVAEGFGSRSALYRRLANLRQVLTAHGLGPAWDDLAAT
jgi:DNA-directed RNA polymerase specialized sigma24 family protein